MSPTAVGEVSDEERLVAELEALGVRYLSRQTSYLAERPRPADALIAGLVRQSRARVRNAVIAGLLARPDYADSVSSALAQLEPVEQTRLRILQHPSPFSCPVSLVHLQDVYVVRKKGT